MGRREGAGRRPCAARLETQEPCRPEAWHSGWHAGGHPGTAGGDGRRRERRGRRRPAARAADPARAGRGPGRHRRRLSTRCGRRTPPADRANALQSLVSRLRRALPDALGAASPRPGGYRLDLPPDDVDAHRFERLAGEGRRALRGGRPGGAAAACCARRSRCGAARRWPTPRRPRSPTRAPPGWTELRLAADRGPDRGGAGVRRGTAPPGRRAAGARGAVTRCGSGCGAC